METNLTRLMSEGGMCTDSSCKTPEKVWIGEDNLQGREKRCREGREVGVS